MVLFKSKNCKKNENKKKQYTNEHRCLLKQMKVLEIIEIIQKMEIIQVMQTMKTMKTIHLARIIVKCHTVLYISQSDYDNWKNERSCYKQDDKYELFNV